MWLQQQQARQQAPQQPEQQDGLQPGAQQGAHQQELQQLPRPAAPQQPQTQREVPKQPLVAAGLGVAAQLPSPDGGAKGSGAPPTLESVLEQWQALAAQAKHALDAMCRAVVKQVRERVWVWPCARARAFLGNVVVVVVVVVVC